MTMPSPFKRLVPKPVTKENDDTNPAHLPRFSEMRVPLHKNTRFDRCSDGLEGAL